MGAPRSVSGGGACVDRGMSSFTACVITGSVRMNKMSNTNMTSINGVVFMSTIGSPSPPPPTCIAMASTSYIPLPRPPGSVMNPTF
jgi:hypothetical protein